MPNRLRSARRNTLLDEAKDRALNQEAWHRLSQGLDPYPVDPEAVKIGAIAIAERRDADVEDYNRALEYASELPGSESNIFPIRIQDLEAHISERAEVRLSTASSVVRRLFKDKIICVIEAGEIGIVGVHDKRKAPLIQIPYGPSYSNGNPCDWYDD